MATSFIVVRDSLALHNDMAGTVRPGQLILAATGDTIAFGHFPLLESSSGHILSKEHVESSVDVLEHVITDENHGIKAFENHADFCGRIPAVMASCWEVGPLEAMTSTPTNGFQECGSVAAEKLVYRAIFKWDWWDIQIFGCNATVLMAFKMGKVAALIS